jgi:ferredoxin-NADP reductase
MKTIDNFLDKITMYRLILYFLTFLVAFAIILGFFRLLPYSALAIFYSFVVLVFVTFVTNIIFAKLFKVPTNVESVYITAFILTLIISPPVEGEFISTLPLLVLAGFLSMASKYLLNIGHKHIFNPAAVSVFLTTYLIGQSASWWVGTNLMLPLILIGGLLVVRKLRQFHLVIPFVLTSLLVTAVLNQSLQTIPQSFFIALTVSPLLFFAFVMLTEPLTMPYTKKGRIVYGVLVGILFNPQLHLSSAYSSPEAALLIGNLFAYVINPKGKFVFVVEEVKRIAEGVTEYVLHANKKIKNKPGQYMEWTLPAVRPDTRGNRRYFTLASSPTENFARLGVRFYPNGSTFKSTLGNLKVGDKIIGGQLSGDFILPKNKNKKLAFLAGGIGVTPFRSMIKYLIDQNESRDVVMLYSNKTFEEVAYKELFDEAREKLNIKTVYTLSDMEKLPNDWNGERGFINETMLKKNIPDYKEREFYISGSHGMVTAFKDMLQKIGVPKSHIKTDFFPGLV